MNSEEYVNQVNRLMDLQNIYLQVFLALLALAIGFIGFMQLKLSDKKMEQMKEKTKQETIQEIEKFLEVSSLAEFKSNMEKQKEDIEKELSYFSYNQLGFELTKLSNEDNIPLWHLTCLLDIHKSNILVSINNFNYYVLRLDSLISIAYTEKKIDINSPHIDNIVRKMSEFESTFNEKSEKLESFKNSISYYRNNQKS